ncbi:sulfite exporter TauE/SafE family protein [candidate division KSB1 bacterium]|nr:sulfite exporter TauE/SafE family protein [candidate division KSB1 bacterium]
MEITPAIFVVIVGAAFLCEYIDSSLGMGYGTTLTPLLLIAGFAPLQVVPAILFSEFLTGIIAGLFHHKSGNIKLDFKRDNELLKRRLGGLGYIPKSRDSKVIFILTLSGITGAVISVFVAVNISKVVLKTYIGAMVLAIGIMILTQRKHEFGFSWKRLIAIGLISSFNKGISGGGYGPLVTGGQILSGRSAKESIGSTSFTEGLVCLVAFLLYIVLKGNIYWKMTIPLIIGAVASTPLAAFTTKKLKSGILKLVMGILISVLGALTLAKVYILK